MATGTDTKKVTEPEARHEGKVTSRNRTTTAANTQVAGADAAPATDAANDQAGIAADEGRDNGVTIGGKHNKRDADSTERQKLDALERDPKSVTDPGTIPGATTITSDRDTLPPVVTDPPKGQKDADSMVGQTIHLREQLVDDDGNQVKGRYADGSRCEAAVVSRVVPGGLEVEVQGRTGQDRTKTVPLQPGKGWHLPSDD